MAKVVVWNLITLDGFFEGPEKWDLGFHGSPGARNSGS